jgi:hypothetical protein
MNKQDAIDMMESGVKMTHENFEPDEWIYIKNGVFVINDTICSALEFWRCRRDESWDKNWKKWEKKD